MPSLSSILTHTGRTALAGVIGWPIAHSQSPKVHGYWLALYGIDGAYLPLAVSPDRLGEAIAGLPALGFRGANVTIPYKEAVLPFLDQITDVARQIGAVNTLIVGEDERITGTNTDAQGFLDNLRHQAPEWTTGCPAAVVGAGGAARAVCAALMNAGVPEILVFNRTVEKAEDLADSLQIHHTSNIHPLPLTEKSWKSHAKDLGLMVNATALGMCGHSSLSLDLDVLGPKTVVADIVYTPLKTPLLDAAARRGLKTVDGLGMLLHQARAGFAQWFGVMPEVTPDLRDFILANRDV
ncbi:MAG: shikimate dehydrogenase [Rhodospirillaceae bacterium]|nr:shikimate dehydrogenase [Rhodospirillaceae bacterium]